jgi:hypothetical protein
VVSAKLLFWETKKKIDIRNWGMKQEGEHETKRGQVNTTDIRTFITYKQLLSASESLTNEEFQ